VSSLGNIFANCYFNAMASPKGLVVLCKSLRCKNPVAKRGRICDSCPRCKSIIHIKQRECARHMLEAKGGVTRRTRESISSAIRREVYERYFYTCVLCGLSGKGKTHSEKIKGFEIDHIKPAAAGGSTKIDNLQVLCRKCNNSKRHYRIK
jgi:5-methylcytosine-specific restriction endonuclease McrA